MVLIIVTMVVQRLKLHLEGNLGTQHLVVMIVSMMVIFLHKVLQVKTVKVFSGAPWRLAMNF